MSLDGLNDNIIFSTESNRQQLGWDRYGWASI